MTVYLTGVLNGMVRESAHRHNLGLLITPDTAGMAKAIPEFAAFALDNGCFSQAHPWDDKREARWLRFLDRMPRAGCLWAACPDVVGDAAATLVRSRKYLRTIRQLGFPAAYVAQNGATVDSLPWDEFDALFIGGSTECIPCGYTRPAADFRQKRCPHCDARLTEWKCSDAALVLIREAQSRGMQVHIGRVNTTDRFRWSRDVAVADTADGTMILHGMAKAMAKLTEWLDESDDLEAQAA